MARITNTKCRICRRAGNKLFLKGEKCFTSKCAVAKRNFPPGQHGPTQGPIKDRKMTDFGKQMREKQKAKAMYFILEKQFRTYVDKAVEMPGDTSINLHNLLESRLDNVVFRLGFANSRAASRQLVSHGLITVNGKTVSIPSYCVSIGSIVSLAKIPKNPSLLEILKNKLLKIVTPSWLVLNQEKFEGKVVSALQPTDVEGSFNAGQVIEFYSR